MRGQAGGVLGADGDPSQDCHSFYPLTTPFGPERRREGSTSHPGAPAEPAGPLGRGMGCGVEHPQSGTLLNCPWGS